MPKWYQVIQITQVFPLFGWRSWLWTRCLTNLVLVPFLQVFPFLLLFFEGDHAIYGQRHCPWFSKYLNYIHFYALQRSKNLNQSKIMTSPKIQEESTTVDNLDRWSLPPSVLGLLLWWTEGGRLSESAGWRLHWSPRTNCISAKTSQLGPIRSGIVTRGTEAAEDLNHHQLSNILNSDAKQLSNCSSIPAVPLYSGLQTT